MAVSAGAAPALRKLLRFSLSTANLERLAAFYSEAFGCRSSPVQRVTDAHFRALMAVAGGAQFQRLWLGQSCIELLQFDQSGAPYPPAAAASDLLFQHFAIVVSDMQRAYERLSSVAGWRRISTAGPQQLPARSGGVCAYKFRDPDGHPLELLAFAPGQLPPAWRATADGALCLGIDHSAISVSDSARSIAFYEALGLRLYARSINHGAEQARLDGLAEPQVEVSALGLAEGAAHLELLCYRALARAAPIALRNNDIAATRLVLQSAGAGPARELLDPDGHHLLLLAGAAATKTDNDAAWSES